MSMVKVTYYGLIQTTSGNREEEIYLSVEATVKELLQLLVERHGSKFGSSLLTSEGQLQPMVMIHLNGGDITEINGLDTKLKDNSELSITILGPIVTGG